MATNYDNPSIYVADLKAYNEGKLIGEWVDLTEFDEGYEVMEKISDLMDGYSKKYHNGMETEYAIHDFENFSRELYSESMGEEDFDIILKTHKISEERDIPAEVLQDVMARYDSASKDIETFIDDRYRGQFDTETDFAYDYIDMMGGIENLSKDTIDMYFDYASFGNDYVINYIDVVDGHYFDNSYEKGGKIKTHDLKKYMKKGGKLKSFFGKAKEVGGKAYEKGREVAHYTKEKAKEGMHNASKSNTLGVLDKVKDKGSVISNEDATDIENTKDLVQEHYKFEPTPFVPKNNDFKAKGGQIDENKAHYYQTEGNIFVDSNFVNMSKGNIPNSELKHYGYGDFYLDTPKGNIDFFRVDKDIEGFVGRTHKLKASDELASELFDAMIERDKVQEIRAYAKGGSMASGGEIEELAENLMRQDDLWEVEGVSNETYDKYHKLAEDILKSRKIEKNHNFAKGGEIETVSDLYDNEEASNYPYARDMVAYFMFGDRDNLIADAIKGKYTPTLADESRLSEIMIGYEYTWQDNMEQLDVDTVEELGGLMDYYANYAKGGKTKRSKHSLMQDRRRVSSESWEVAYQKRKKNKMDKGGLVNKEFLSNQTSDYTNRILQSIADYYGTTKSKIQRELYDDDAEMIYEYIGNDRGLRKLVYDQMESFKYRNNYAKGGNVNGKPQRTDLIAYYIDNHTIDREPPRVDTIECSVYVNHEHQLEAEINECLNNRGIYNSKIKGYKIVGKNPHNFSSKEVSKRPMFNQGGMTKSMEVEEVMQDHFDNGGSVGKNITYSATFDLMDADGNNIDNPFPSLQFDVSSDVSYGDAKGIAQKTYEGGSFFEEGMKAVITDFWMGEMEADEEDRKRVEVQEEEEREEFVPRVERSGKWDASYSVLCDELATYEQGGSMASGGEITISYEDEILPILKEKLEDSVEDLSDTYDQSYQAEGEEIEHKSRDGFIAFTDGGYEVHWFEYVNMLNGSGTSLPTKVLDDEMERQVGNQQQYAIERIKEDYPNLEEEIGKDKINYSDLYDLDKGEIAEELDQYANDDSDDSIYMKIEAMYFSPNNGRGQDGKHTIALSGDVNLEAPYHRRGNLDDYNEVVFTFDSATDLENKLDANLIKIIDWFKGENYNESTREMKIRRMAKGGSIKGRNNKSGESFGVVIGSKEFTDDDKDRISLNVRSSYSSRMSERKLVFDTNGNLIETLDYGYTLDGTYPNTSGGSGRNIGASNKKETIDAMVDLGYNKGFANKVIEFVKE